MKALILAAGYATRLYPLTKDRPKPLLPVAGRPVLDWVVDRLLGLADLTRIHVVTNHKFNSHFTSWVRGHPAGRRISIHDDGSTCEEDRLGAVGDMRLVIERTGMDEDLLVAAGDNLFDFDLEPLRKLSIDKAAPAVGIRQGATLEEVKRFGVVVLDRNGRITGFEEKPEKPKSLDFSLCLYHLPASTLHLVTDYLDQGGNPDAPGMYLSWLVDVTDTYGHRFSHGEWFDIGDKESLEEANRRFTARYG